MQQNATNVKFCWILLKWAENNGSCCTRITWTTWIDVVAVSFWKGYGLISGTVTSEHVLNNILNMSSATNSHDSHVYVAKQKCTLPNTNTFPSRVFIFSTKTITITRAGWRWASKSQLFLLTITITFLPFYRCCIQWNWFWVYVFLFTV